MKRTLTQVPSSPLGISENSLGLLRTTGSFLRSALWVVSRTQTGFPMVFALLFVSSRDEACFPFLFKKSSTPSNSFPSRTNLEWFITSLSPRFPMIDSQTSTSLFSFEGFTANLSVKRGAAERKRTFVFPFHWHRMSAYGTPERILDLGVCHSVEAKSLFSWFFTF